MVRNLPTARHDVRVSFFTAVIAGHGHTWRARDVELEDAASLDDLADMLRAAHHTRGPILAVIEHEDEWFALVRVDGEEDPRVFVSDMVAATRSPYGDLLAPAADIDVPLDEEDDEQAESVGPDDGLPADDEVPADDEPVADGAAGVEGVAETGETDGVADVEADLASARIDVKVLSWAGEPDILEDLGVDGRRMRKLVEKHGEDPATVLAEIGEECGFGELLDALR
jgi:putative tRNA adenosine deaminase-associated protein